jgi:transcriptional regulator with XRE-family HTH domain
MEKSQHTRKYRRLLRFLRKVRKEVGLTQLEVAAKLDTYKTYSSKIEAGERRIDVIELAELCTLYNIPLKRVFRVIEKD